MESRRVRLALALGVCVAVAVVVPVAWAALDNGGVITVCAKDGAWRSIDTQAGSACKSNETQLQVYSKAGADAAFLGAAGKAADADKLDGVDSTGFLGASAKAADADKLDGIDSTGFLSASGKAADADKLDGLDSTSLVQGGGGRSFLEVQAPIHNVNFALNRITSAGALQIFCANAGIAYTIAASGADRVVWMDPGEGGSIARIAVPTGSGIPIGPVFTDHSHAVIRSVGGGWAATWDVMASHDGSGCLISVQEDIAPVS